MQSNHVQTEESEINFVYDIITDENFATCSGTMQSFFKQLQYYETELTDMLNADQIDTTGKAFLKRYNNALYIAHDVAKLQYDV